uniref:protein-tyrosine-phosphatase n=1 Tax=Hyaloperonospora arabidopsidis (strain Emoy2) TaxID=559515 RepID=M4C493_HYAAE
MSYFIPPVNYGMVEEDLYRSGQPNELNFPFLERLNLRTIIYLALEEPNPQFQSFVEEQEIQLVFLGGNTRMESRRKSWEPLSEETVLAALDIILDRSNYPLYLTCHLGRDRTGAVVGCLRKIQGWHLSSIFEEYRRFAGSKVRLQNEQFIELFDTDLVTIPAKSPSWVRKPQHL